MERESALWTPPPNADVIDAGYLCALALVFVIEYMLMGDSFRFWSVSLISLVVYCVWKWLYVGDRRQVFKEWGLHFENIAVASIVPVLVIAVASVAVLPVALSGKLPAFDGTHLAICIILYPYWGLAQQFITLSLVAENLHIRLTAKGYRTIATVSIVATAFGLLHLVINPWLALATFIMELIWTPHFLHYHNLIPLGIAHGVLGTMFFFLVLAQDAWPLIQY